MAQVRIAPDAEALAQEVAAELVDRLAAIQAEGRDPSIVLTGGTIAAEIYRAVAAGDTSAVDWTRVDFWWGDERYVAADSSDRNDRVAELDLLDSVGVDPLRVHAMPALDEAHPDVAVAAASYAETVRRLATEPFDLVLLGVGPDGHVASLFPESSQLHVNDVEAVAVTDSPKPPAERITLTFPVLNRTREVWFLVAGAEKSGAVALALADTGSVEAIPARGITCLNATWWLDPTAAQALHLT